MNNAYLKENKTFYINTNEMQNLTLEINNIPMNELKLYLEKKYGLSFKEESIDIEMVRVMFN